MPRIYVLAGVNGAGKSSIGGAAFRASGADYFNPDEVARALIAADHELTRAEANGRAWQLGRSLLERSIAEGLDFVFETTLGGGTMQRLLRQAAAKGFGVYVWYVGLSSPELHIARVRARVSKGGHDIPEKDIRRRYEHSRLNLIDLLPHLAALRVHDNSAESDPAKGKAPEPVLVLHMERGKIRNAADLRDTPAWAKPIVVAAMKLNLS